MENNATLVLVNYKEPLIEVEKGFGYLGALRMTQDGTLMECHVCGQLYKDVGRHVNNAHNITATQYREKFQLARTTALVSEAEREARKRRTVNFFASLTYDQKQKHREKSNKNLREFLKKRGAPNKFKISLETKNKRGSCPDQIADQIRKCSDAIGHAPSKGEFMDWSGSTRYVGLARTTFGGWRKAVEYAGLKPKQKYVHPVGRTIRRRSEDELLELLSLFYQETGRVPTHTDFKRGLLPNAQIYKRKFGSIPNARRLAGITEVPPGRWGGLKEYGNSTDN